MKNSILLLALIAQSIVFGQSAKYEYKRELNGVEDDWHSIQLPNDIFQKVKPNLSDFRIYGTNEAGEEIEAPFIIQTKADKITTEEIDFVIINFSKKSEGYYFTLRLNVDETINEISLDFGLENFDWDIKLEGSQDQSDWYTIEDAYRIMSIKNGELYYVYNRIRFADSKYKYYRIFVPSAVNPEFKKAQVTRTVVLDGKSNEYNIVSQTITEDKGSKETIIEFSLENVVPVNKIKIEASDDFDYYRPIRILCATDSSKSEKGYILNYSEPANGTFSSFVNNEWTLSDARAKDFKIIIKNNDNQPLHINKVSASGYQQELIARFTEKADYSLFYGYSSASFPKYDIANFTNTIPELVAPLKMDQEIEIASSTESENDSGFFENPMWLWGIMGLVIVLLGFFTFKMLGSEDK